MYSTEAAGPAPASTTTKTCSINHSTQFISLPNPIRSRHHQMHGLRKARSRPTCLGVAVPARSPEPPAGRTTLTLKVMSSDMADGCGCKITQKEKCLHARWQAVTGWLRHTDKQQGRLYTLTLHMRTRPSSEAEASVVAVAGDHTMLLMSCDARH